jgi:hypothetical protein
MTKIVYVFADTPQEMNCSVHDCIRPAQAINKDGRHHADCIHISQFVQNSDETQRIIQESDIIIVERNLFGDVLPMMWNWKVKNKSVATIFDDGYQCMHPKNVSYAFWTHGEVKYKDEQGVEHIDFMKPPPLKQLEWGIQMSKGLQTVSKTLASDWAYINDTYIINNHINVDEYVNKEPLYKHDDIWIGWGGSLSHMDSFESSGILKALKKIVKTYKNVKLLISGDHRVYELIDVPIDKKIFQPYVSPEHYASLIKSIDIYPIALAGDYDRRRSWIKGLEASICKIPWVASDWSVYDNMRQYTILTENGSQNWEEKLVEMIDNLPRHKERVQYEPYQFALEQDYMKHIDERINLYQKLIDKPYR